MSLSRGAGLRNFLEWFITRMAMRFHWSSSAAVWLLLLAGTVAFVGTSAALYLGLEDVLDRNKAREHARQAQLLIRRTAMLMLDLETGQRGFIITGQPAFLEPYEHARAEFDDTYKSLRAHLAEELPVPPPLQRLDVLSRERLAQVERNVGQRWAMGDAVLKDVKGFESGKALMDRIRLELAELEQIEEARVRHADEGTLVVQKRTIVLAGALPAIGTAMIIGAAVALRHQSRRRDEAEQALTTLNQALEQTVANRTGRLREALTRIQHFATELDASIETERRQLAREVHDQIGQIGTSIKMLALSMRRRIGDEHRDSVQELIALADEGINAARSISAALRPPLLDDFGLAAALDHYAKGLARRGGIEVKAELSGDSALTPIQANQLFRIVQEASTNVLRHAAASQLDLRGEQVEGEMLYQLDIIDNGVGLGQVRADASGLRNMRERAAMSGGRLDMGSGPNGRGTRVTVILPLAAAPQEDLNSGEAG